jgi:hypothetical protein
LATKGVIMNLSYYTSVLIITTALMTGCGGGGDSGGTTGNSYDTLEDLEGKTMYYKAYSNPDGELLSSSPVPFKFTSTYYEGYLMADSNADSDTALCQIAPENSSFQYLCLIGFSNSDGRVSMAFNVYSNEEITGYMEISLDGDSSELAEVSSPSLADIYIDGYITTQNASMAIQRSDSQNIFSYDNKMDGEINESFAKEIKETVDIINQNL